MGKLLMGFGKGGGKRREMRVAVLECANIYPISVTLSSRKCQIGNYLGPGVGSGGGKYDTVKPVSTLNDDEFTIENAPVWITNE
jgi:hypothetical protein